MKAPIETTGNITSEIPSGITSTSNSHSLRGMAEHLSGGEFKLQITNYELQITNISFYKLLKKTKNEKLSRKFKTKVSEKPSFLPEEDRTGGDFLITNYQLLIF